jgi:two-component system LytT family response regulator
VVNLDRVREIHPLFYGDSQVILRDGTRLTLSRRFRDSARQALGLH